MNTKTVNKFRTLALSVLSITLALQWGRAQLPGGLSLLFSDLGLILFLAFGLLAWAVGRPRISSAVRTLVIVYVIYWVLNSLFFYVHSTPLGFRLTRQGVLFTATLLMLGYLKVRPSDMPLFARIGLVTLILFFIVSAANQNMSFFSGFVENLASYDYRSMLSRFYRPIFNAFNPSVDSFYISGSKRNIVSMSIVLYMLLFLVSMREPRAKILGLADRALLFIALILLITMFARSVLVIGVVCVFVYFSARQSNRSRAGKILLSIPIIFSVVAVTALATDVGQLAYERVFEDTASYEFRLNQFSEFFDAISGNYLFGIGFYETVDGSTLHNIFLGSWAHAGILGLLGAIFLYFHVLKSFVGGALSFRNTLQAMLFVPFLVKTLIGGNAGFPDLPILVALCVGVMQIEYIDRSNARPRVPKRKPRRRVD